MKKSVVNPGPQSAVLGQELTPKAGDVVLIRANGQKIIGIFESYCKETREISLSWPSKAFYYTEQEFFQVDINAVEVLSSQEVLGEFAEFLEQRDRKIENGIKGRVGDAFNFSTLIPRDVPRRVPR